MSVRQTNRKLTGTPRRAEPEIVLGYRAEGNPGITLSISWETYGCFDDAAMVEQLIADLQAGLEHLRGGSKTIS